MYTVLVGFKDLELNVLLTILEFEAKPSTPPPQKKCVEIHPRKNQFVVIQEHNGILYAVLELKKNECQSTKESQKSFNQFIILVLLTNALPYILMLQYYNLNSEPGIVQRTWY